jgi:hypothetical protein
MNWHDYLPYIVFVVTVIGSFLSAMASGGGANVVTPLLIAAGLSPQHSIATAKLWAIGTDSGSLVAFRARATKHKHMAAFLVIVSIPIAIAASWGIRHLPNENLKLAIGALNLALVPVLFIKHHKIKSRRRHEALQILGFIALILFMMLGSVLSAGMGGIISVILIAVFGISALETNFIKRRASLVADVIIIFGLIGSGLIDVKYGLIIACAGLVGGYSGSKFVLREGEKFARYVLMTFMVVSGIWLIATAR